MRHFALPGLAFAGALAALALAPATAVVRARFTDRPAWTSTTQEVRRIPQDVQS